MKFAPIRGRGSAELKALYPKNLQVFYDLQAVFSCLRENRLRSIHRTNAGDLVHEQVFAHGYRPGLFSGLLMGLSAGFAGQRTEPTAD